jgi:hypothetical protein
MNGKNMLRIGSPNFGGIFLKGPQKKNCCQNKNAEKKVIP